VVSALPDGYLDYIKGNKEAISKVKKQPYFIRDNYKGGQILGGLKIPENWITCNQATKTTCFTANR
jgi:hypothetical protein